MKAALIALGCLTAITVLGAPSFGQVPLPSEMHAQYTFTTNYAERMYLTEQGDLNLVRIDIGFDNKSENQLWISWTAQATGAVLAMDKSYHSVSYQPTAVARRAGSDDVFYVVGWSPRTEQVVVEEWTVGTFAVGQTIPPGGGAPQTLFSLPQISRSLLWVSGSGQLQPIWDGACYPFGNELWLLESGTVTKIHALNLDSPPNLSLRVSSNDTGMNQLQGHRSFAVGSHPTAGFVIKSHQKTPHLSLITQDKDAPDYISVDSDSDGVMDSTSFAAHLNFYVAFPLPWTTQYVAP